MKKNTLDKKYTDLLQDIIDNGKLKGDRTGTGTLSVFGREIRHTMSEGFPLITSKKMYWKGIVTELLWFLRGDTNIKYLVDNGCNIWNGDCYKYYLDNCKPERGDEPDWMQPDVDFQYLSEEQFIEKIKTDDEFVKKLGDMGPIYGKQWRQWQGWMDMPESTLHAKGSLWFDQIKMMIHLLKTDPDSRRMVVNAWNVGELKDMKLPPCHYGFELYTRELTTREMCVLANVDYDKCIEWTYHGKNIDRDLETRSMLSDENVYNIPTRAISLRWIQRSVDTFLGLPFNIASYGLLLEIIAKEVNMVPEELIGSLGDVHLYTNHIEQAKEQIGREPFDLPRVVINDEFWNPNCSFIEQIEHIEISDFDLRDYQSHPPIKAPLSN